MQDRESELRRIPLPRTLMNKARKWKGLVLQGFVQTGIMHLMHGTVE